MRLAAGARKQTSAALGAAPIGRVGGWARLAVWALLGSLLVFSGTPPELRVRQVTAPYAFRLLDWELGRLGERGGRLVWGLIEPAGGIDSPAREAVARFFRAPRPMREPFRPEAEAAIERALTADLAAEGLGIPISTAPTSGIVFPPVSFSFTAPPQVLIVSPRDRIAVSQSELVRPDMTVGQAQTLEAEVERLDVASLVVPIGGLATYPAIVLEDHRPLDAMIGVAHEWIHGYFFFHPLGRAYWSSQAARMINETAADMASRELGERLADRLRLEDASYQRADPGRPEQVGRQSGRDFRSLIRAARLRVDELLAAGQVEEAEAYMRERRDDLAASGYEIRKLNQAYFAFYGSYGDSAAGASPIPGRLRRLRDNSSSLGEFLRRVARLTSGDDLARAVGDA